MKRDYIIKAGSHSPLVMLSSRKPEWLKVRPPAGENYSRIKLLLRDLRLHTVCEEAHCPNVFECWGGGTATIMLLGDVCTRGCRFCAVKSGNPGGIVDPEEPDKVAEALTQLHLKYVVLTSGDRDDLPDGGSGHFAATVKALKMRDPNILVEVLIPDFRGDVEAMRTVLGAEPDVLAHNIETVRRLSPMARDRRASYDQSLFVLRRAKQIAPHIFTKSSLMLGLGEEEAEIVQAFYDLREAKVDFLTLGQYLRPSEWHLPVSRFVTPEDFKHYGKIAEELGFMYVASGPLVRSSYKAGERFIESVVGKGGGHEH